MGRIRVAQAYTGPVGAEIVRRLASHPTIELVGVLVHSPEKEGRDSGEVAGGAPNGITTTRSLDEIIALKPDGVIWSGLTFDVAAHARILAAGINLYTGVGGFYLKGRPEEAVLAEAARQGRASFCAGGNIPGLISDVLPLFLSGYTGQIRQIRAFQRNHLSEIPSAVQLQMGLGIGLPPEGNPMAQAASDAFTDAIAQSAQMVADALCVTMESFELVKLERALASQRVVLPRCGLVIEPGTVANIRWTWSATGGGREFYRISNEQSSVLGLGDGWRETVDEPAYRVEIDGEPSLYCTMGWPDGSLAAASNHSLNAVRAINVMQRLVAARPGLLTIADFPAPVASEGLATL